MAKKHHILMIGNNTEWKEVSEVNLGSVAKPNKDVKAFEIIPTDKIEKEIWII